MAASKTWGADNGAIYEGGEYFVADTRNRGKGDPTRAEHLRAQMIAKMPELVDAVDALLERMSDFPGFVDDVSEEHDPVSLLMGEIKTLRASIAKAEGE